MDPATPNTGPTLARDIGLLALAATGICSMLGAAINFIPFTLQRDVPGIGPYVLPAYALAAVPAVLAAMAYSILGSAMPRAGGSYVCASRAMHPYFGFVASFSQWFGLSTAIGVVSYLLVVPFGRDVAVAMEWQLIVDWLAIDAVHVGVALAVLWLFVGVNLLGVRSYARTLVPLMFLMFGCGAVVIVAGFAHDTTDFATALEAREGASVPATPAGPLTFETLLAGAAVLFSSFIGFDSIAQASGEARNPNRSVPLAIGIAMVTVGGFYFLFTAAVYHAVPWSFVAERAQTQDITAPALLGYLLAPEWTVVIMAGALVALINDLPAMLLAVSRLMFAWAEDGIFPRAAAHIHPVRRTPYVAIVASGLMASAAIGTCALAGDAFLGINILAISMLVNFLLMCIAVITLPRTNPRLAREIRFLPGRFPQLVVGWLGAVILTGFLIVHVRKDLSAPADAWYLRSTWLWLFVMAVASAIFSFKWSQLRRDGVDVKAVFSELPPG